MIRQVWIIEQYTALSLVDDLSKGIYILVGADFKPLLDKTGRPYRSGSIMDAERQTKEVLQPYLVAITRPR